jgi:hypothetical protein
VETRLDEDIAMCMEHIPVSALFEKARLKTELSVEKQSHVEGCNSCRKQLNWMQIGGEGNIEEPPQSVMDKSFELVVIEID